MGNLFDSVSRKAMISITYVLSGILLACFGGGLMVIAAVVEAFLGIKAERQSLESIAAPLSSLPRAARA